MDQAIIKKLKNLCKKWKTERTREAKFQAGELTGYKPGSLALEKSCGIWIGYASCIRDLEALIEKTNASDS